jgi:hypothetical protein
MAMPQWGFNRADGAQHEPGRADALKICSDTRNYKHSGFVNEPKTTQIGANRTIINWRGISPPYP